MNKIWIFILGTITGIILTILFLSALYISSDNHSINMFEQPGDCLVTKSSLKVFQVLEPGAALTMIKGQIDSPVFLLINGEGQVYYDDQVIKLPSEQCFRQVGTYQYQTKDQRLKTVPIVQII